MRLAEKLDWKGLIWCGSTNFANSSYTYIVCIVY